MRKGGAAAGTGEGGDKGGQAMASGEGAEVVTVGADWQGEEPGEQAVARRQADLFNLAASDRLGRSLVGKIRVVSDEERGTRGGWQGRGTKGSQQHSLCLQLP